MSNPDQSPESASDPGKREEHFNNYGALLSAAHQESLAAQSEQMLRVGKSLAPQITSARSLD